LKALYLGFGFTIQGRVRSDHGGIAVAVVLQVSLENYTQGDL